MTEMQVLNIDELENNSQTHSFGWPQNDHAQGSCESLNCHELLIFNADALFVHK
jgi:hypothetical protein